VNLASLLARYFRKQKTTRKEFARRRRSSLRIEGLEQRAVFDAAGGDLLAVCNAPVAAAPAYESSETVHPVFAPDTPWEITHLYEEAGPAEPGIDFFSFNDSDRWSRTVTNPTTLSQGDPTTLTWSVVPDGTPVGSYNGEPANPSNLRSYLAGIYGSNSSSSRAEDQPWFPVMKSVFDRWTALSGVTYVYVSADDGASLGSSSPGVAGVRGDVRISGHYIDGPSNILAYNFFPTVGDMVLDTGDSFFTNTAGNSLRLRNTMAHEAGHGLGLGHVQPVNGTKLMEPTISLNYDGPQADDILAINRGYGDILEKNGGNNTAATGTPVTLTSASFTIDTLSIDDDADFDYFKLAVPSGQSLNVTLTPTGSSYTSNGATFNSLAQSDLALAVYDTNGTTILASANINGAGAGESITNLVLPGSGTYYVRVTGNANAAQMYRLSGNLVSLSPNPNAVLYDGSTILADGSGVADFGSTLVGTDVTKTFTVKNAGLQTLVLNPTITLPSGFTLVSGFSQTSLATNQSATFVVKLDATTAGSPSGTLSFTSNDPDESPYDVRLTGDTVTPAAFPFTDNFNRPDGTNLSANWIEQAGDLALAGNRVVSQAAAASVATVRGLSAADVIITGDVNVGTGAARSIGFSARYSGPGDNNQYLGMIGQDSGRYTAYIYRNVGGNWTLLKSGSISSGSGTLKFEVEGTSLRLSFNGTLILSATDSSITSAGAVGIRAWDAGATIDNFQTAILSTDPLPPNPEPAPSQGDDFERADSSSLGTGWTEQAGDLAIVNGRIQSQVSGASLATMTGISVSDVTLTADVDVGSTTMRSMGLTARHSGPGENNQYLGMLSYDSGRYTAYIYRNVGGNWTLLSSAAATKGSGNLKFEVVGTSLQLSLDNALLASANDSAIRGPGAVGIRSWNSGAVLDNFQVATNLDPQPQPSVIDDFNRIDSPSLGALWSEAVGDYSLSNGRAVSKSSGASLALYGTTTYSDAILSADVDVGASAMRSIGLTARYGGPGENNQYLGMLGYDAGRFTVYIYRNVGGNWTMLKSADVSTGTGTLKFEVQGSSLKLSFNGNLIISATDNALTSGQIGIRGWNAGAAVDNFQAIV
jgi:hypothetical protein